MAVDHDNLICTMWQLFVIEYSRVSLRGQGKLYTTLYHYKLERKYFYYNRVSTCMYQLVAGPAWLAACRASSYLYHMYTAFSEFGQDLTIFLLPFQPFFSNVISYFFFFYSNILIIP